MTRAVVVGSAGQDGHYLTEQLRAAGYSVTGLQRSRIVSERGGEQSSEPVDLLDQEAVGRFISAHSDTRVLFYLAAFHHSSEESHESDVTALVKQSFALHVDGWVNVLGALQRYAPGCRSFYAASSHVFGEPQEPLQNEATPLRPTNVYGITKVAGLNVARYFRARGQHCSVGILYNHESEHRQLKFVSQRIAHGAVQAARAVREGQPYTLELGSLSAVVDWGYAGDYVAAMLRIVEHEVPDDYVIASGQPHTVADFCAAAFGAVGLDWRKFVVERPGRITKQLAPLVGDAAKLRSIGWSPKVPFERLVESMVAAAGR